MNLLQMYCPRCKKPIPKTYGKKQMRCKSCFTMLRFQCRRCNRQYKTITGFDAHLKSNCTDSVKMYQCPECDYMTQRVTNLRSHSLMHSLQPRCNWCMNSCKTEEALQRHRDFNCAKRPAHMCVHCKYTPPSREMLVKHLQRRHPQQYSVSMYKNVFICNKCSKDCYSSLQLHYHTLKNTCTGRVK